MLQTYLRRSRASNKPSFDAHRSARRYAGLAGASTEGMHKETLACRNTFEADRQLWATFLAENKPRVLALARAADQLEYDKHAE